jgi:exodeoxyribonuclease V beta subunit
VLGGLGVAGDTEPDVTFVEDISDLVEEVVDDLYVRRFHRRGMPQFPRAEAMRIARAAVENPAARIEPQDAPEDSVAAMRRRLAVAVQQELEQRKRRLRILTYDDLLTRLRDALRGETAAARLRARYRVVLVDEFQDTDPVQWEIMRRAFGSGGSTLVLIGDPKQAIYAFRGADVYAYLEAARTAGARATLQTNWRSDQGLIDAYDALFGGARLGHEGIAYRRVKAANPSRFDGTPLRVRIVHRDDVQVTRGGFASNSPAREHIAKDLAADLVRLLSAGVQAAGKRVAPGDVAVLVRTHRNAALVRDALEEAGIPAVINGAGSVFGTPPARDWLRLLEAIERPASAPRARAAALTAFLGWSAARVASAADAEWEEVHRRLHQWARVLREKGVAALAETIMLAERLPARVLSAVDGERSLTDLRHVGQLLHAAAATEQMGATALTSWLRQRIAAAEQETGDEERSRRLESDAEAVQVLTIHRSKGLEFPIVYHPFLWEPGYIAPGRQPVFFHDPDAGDARTIDVGLDGPDFPRHQRQHLTEQRGEDLRLAYVALSRARHQAVVWWAGSWDSRHSALGRLLFARDDEGNVAAEGSRTPSDAEATARFEELAAAAPGCISVERSALGLPLSWSGAPEEHAALAAAMFDRALDRGWRRTSYSDITAGAYEAARVASEPEEPVVDDEPAGVEYGTFVHRVLEATDFAAADLHAELSTRVRETLARRAVEIGDEAAVVAGLRAAIEAPLPVGVRLRDLTRADRLDELDFELPLAGGDDPTGHLTLRAIGDVLRAHGDPLGYADRLDDPALRQDVRGYLTGSIDLVLRAGGRFAVVDYKTNRLAAYDASALEAEMRRGHYGLQALLYTAALHRYLRWRLPRYDPERDLAGVYLFLRGMGDGGGGVFAWRPPAGLVEELSEVLDG